MKMLNLDALAKQKRTLTLANVEHVVNEMTVDNFIATTETAEKLEKSTETTFRDQIVATIEMIQRSVPTCPVEQLRALTIEQLVLISKFLRGELDDQAEAVGGDGKK